MKFGVSVGNLAAFGDEPGVHACLQLAETAEQLGFDSVWVSDHIVRPVGQKSPYPYNPSGTRPTPQPDSRINEPLTLLAALAARTTRVSLGTSVLIIPYRNPLILANSLATIDQISRGRVILGIGVGWQEEEFEALGVAEFYRNRGRVTDEWMEVRIADAEIDDILAGIYGSLLAARDLAEQIGWECVESFRAREGHIRVILCY